MRPHTVLYLRLSVASIFSALFLILTGCNNDVSSSSDPHQGDAEPVQTGTRNPTQRSEVPYAAAGVPGRSGALGIDVIGVGEVSVEPDTAKISIGIEVFHNSASTARSLAAESHKQVVDALKKLGLDEDDMRTARFSINAEYVYEQITVPTKDLIGSRSPQRATRTERRIIGYRVNNTLTVTTSDINQLGTMIDTATDSGGDKIRIDGLQFFVRDNKQHQEHALKLAVADAHRRANIVASQSDVSLGKLRYITETANSQSSPYMSISARSYSEDSSTPILTGQQVVKVTVYALFAID